MPAGSEPDRAASQTPRAPGPAVRLPLTFRPFGARVAVGVLGAVLTVAVLGTWIAFPPSVRAQFTPFQILTLLVLGGMFYAVGLGLARSRVVARPEGLVVVNGYRTRRFAWNEVLAVNLRPGSPWASLDLADGSTSPVMGIQGSDGDRARRAVRRLRGLVADRTR